MLRLEQIEKNLLPLVPRGSPYGSSPFAYQERRNEWVLTFCLSKRVGVIVLVTLCL